MRGFYNWLDDRTGYRPFMRALLYENIPGGSRWRYVWGSTLVFTFTVQMITGVCLWMAYSPSSQTAWESVYYIQHEMSGGSLLRGIHHYTAHAMVVLLVLHVMQVVIDGAYKAPREINFWIGLGLAQLVFGLSLTGYLLPWDQKGYWATKVATNLVAIVPGIGHDLQELIVGGSDYGHHTLTRFFALHAGVLPGLLIVFTVAHVTMFRRHGLTAKEPKRGADESFWPDQALKDAVACLAVLAAVLTLTLLFNAPLGAPADASEPYSAARPEWYFLFLFEFLKFFPGEAELWGAIVIPALVMLLLFLMPILGHCKIGHVFNVAFVMALVAGSIVLTVSAWWQDLRSADHQTARQQAHDQEKRVIELAQQRGGFSEKGAVELLRNDPLTQGPKLFAEHCASCHRCDGHNGMGRPVTEPAGSDLAGFSTRRWLTDFFDAELIATDRFFGATKFHDGKMVEFVTDEVSAYDEQDKQILEQVIKALAGEAQRDGPRHADSPHAETIEQMQGWMGDEGLACLDCHRFYGKGPARPKGPDLTGYGSRQWMIDFVSDPSAPKYYGKRNDRMPAFGADGRLSRKYIALIVDWLRDQNDSQP